MFSIGSSWYFVYDITKIIMFVYNKNENFFQIETFMVSDKKIHYRFTVL